MINKQTRDKLVEQSIKEISFARQQKQSRIAQWHKNENLYYSKKITNTDDARANVNLNEMQSFIQTLLSKIDDSPSITFKEGDEAEIKKAKRINALVMKDAKPSNGNWDMIDLMGKVQAALYGRAVYEYHASSLNGYNSKLSNVDVYNFLIDPSAGGIDIENAMYMGRSGIIKQSYQLRKGVKDGIYLRNEVSELLNGLDNENDDSSGQGSPSSVEYTNQSNRSNAVSQGQKVISRNGQYSFWEWYTTGHDGERYYLLLTEQGNKAIRVEKLTDIFESGLYPFMTWAPYVDLTEFWSPSPADGVRELIMAKAVVINQLIDNAEMINKPMRGFDTELVENPILLKYRKDGLIPFKAGTDIQKAIYTFPTQTITTSQVVYEFLSQIMDTQSGVTSAARGLSEDDKVGIYEGNLKNAEDRFGLINKSYVYGFYHRLGELYYNGVMEHLTKKVAIEMIGINGVEYEEITRKDIKPTKKQFEIIINASGGDRSNDIIASKSKLMFFANNRGNQSQNPKKAYEMEALAAGLSRDDIRELLDLSEYADEELLSECARDIKELISGKTVKLNRKANDAYMSKFIDYMYDQEDNLSETQRMAMFSYLEAIKPIVMGNMARKANDMVTKETGMSLPGIQNGTPDLMAGEMNNINSDSQQII